MTEEFKEFLDVAVAEQVGETLYDEDDQPKCMRPNHQNTSRDKGADFKVCHRDAGWGTIHFGRGPCKDHGGDEVTALDTKVDEKFSYSLVVQNDRLKQLLEEEETRENIDNLDNEILLSRALIRFLAEKFGVSLNVGIEEGEPALEIDNAVGLRLITTEIQEIMKLTAFLSSLIRKKYEIAGLAGEVLTREAVRIHMTQIQILLNNTLRNTCPNCQEPHNQREQVMAGLALIGSL